MELRLLLPPTESPRQLPIPRLPSERSFAVDTRALPRVLPLPTLDPNAAAAPFEALARLGATGVKVAAQTTELLLATEAKKRDANAEASATAIYTETVVNLNDAIERLKIETNHETFRPAFRETWNRLAGEALRRDPTPAVQQHLNVKLLGLLAAKSSEVASVDRGKYVAYHQAQLDEQVRTLTTLATNATTDLERDVYLRDLDGMLRGKARSGLFPPDTLAKLGEDAHARVRTERAYSQAFTGPLTLIERVSQGEFADLAPRERRSLLEYAESRIRTLRSDQENADTRERRAVTEAQDDEAITWRQRIAANYQAGGAGQDLAQDLSGAARRLGKENFAALLELHRTYRARFLDPAKGKPSDPETVGRAQYALTTGRLDEVSQADLLRWFRAGDLDEEDYTRLSGTLDTKLAQRKTEGQKVQTEAEQFRARQTKDAEKLIDDYLARGSRFQGDPASKRTDILVRDAITELHLRLQADPAVNPMTVADELIERRIDDAERAVKTAGSGGLPYPSKAAVIEAYQAQPRRLDKATATRYFRLFDALEKGKALAPPEPATPPGLFQRFFGPPDPHAVRPPVTGTP